MAGEESNWIGVDLDGTLAKYDGFKGIGHIGEPVIPMLERVRRWIESGQDVRIFTARVADPEERAEATNVIQDWTEKYLGVRLPVTNVKDHHMVELWDDRAVGVEQNTGLLKAMSGSQTEPHAVASEMADILLALFGDQAEPMFNFVYGSSTVKKLLDPKTRVWNEIDHPRGSNGRFINKYSVEAVDAAKARVREVLAGPRTPLGLKELAENLSILTVNQLKEIKREFGISASGANKESLVQKIADRLHRGRSTESAKQEPPAVEPPVEKKPAEMEKPTPEQILFGRTHASEFKLRGLLRSKIEDGEVVSLLGQEVKNGQDLASIAQVYRDPRYETLRAIYVKDGIIVGHNAYSNKMPDVVNVNMEKFKAQLEEDLKSSGADGFYLLHNHPSGDPTPSRGDANVTGHLADIYGDRFKGHVIINHKRSSFLWKQEEGKLAHEEFNIDNLNLNAKQEIPNEMIGVKINGAEAMANLAVKLGNDITRPVVIATNVKGYVTLVADVGEETLLNANPKVAAAVMRRIGRMTGGNGFKFLVVPKIPGTTPSQNFSKWDSVFKQGWVTDAVIASDGSQYSDTYSQVFGRAAQGDDLSQKYGQARNVFREIAEQKKSWRISKEFREHEHPRGDNGRFIDKADIEEAATGHPRLAGAILRKVSDSIGRMNLAQYLIENGVPEDTVRKGVIIASGKFDRPVGVRPIEYLAQATSEAEDDGIHIPDSALQGKTDDEIAANFDNWIRGGNTVEQLLKPKEKSAKASELLSFYDGKPIDDFSHPFEIDDPSSLKNYPATRDGRIKFLRDMGEELPEVELWRDETIQRAAENKEASFNEWLDEKIIASPTGLAGDLDDMRRASERDGEGWRGLDQRKLDAATQILEKTGGLGTAGRDWSKVEFKPASSFAELHEFWRQNGVYARFDVPDDVEPQMQGSFHGKPERWSLEDANAASAELVSLLKQYPDTQVRVTGLAYAVDKSLWDANLRYHLKREYDLKSRGGKRFSKPAALKRVVESMTAEPPKVAENGKKGFRSDYDWFKMAWWQESNEALIFNHRARLFYATPEKNVEERAMYKDALGERPSGAGSDIEAVTRHEFGHALDSKYRLSTNPEIVKAYSERPDSISGYGATSIKEYIAEGFTDSFYDDGVTSKDSKLIRSVIDSKAGKQ